VFSELPFDEDQARLIDERRPGSSARQVDLAGYLDDSRRFDKKW
jgi:hypothetical protein